MADYKSYLDYMGHITDATKKHFNDQVAKAQQECAKQLADTQQKCNETVTQKQRECDTKVQQEKNSHQQTKSDYENRLRGVQSELATAISNYKGVEGRVRQAQLEAQQANDEALEWQVKYQKAASGKKRLWFFTVISAILAGIFLYLLSSQLRDNRVTLDNPEYTSFIKAFFKNNLFDGFNASSTLQMLIDHPVYGNDADASSPNTASIGKRLQLTPYIAIGNVTFHSADGTPFYKGSSNNKQYNMNAKIAKIEYNIYCNEYIMNELYKVLKAEIESRYGVTVELDETVDCVRKIHFSLPDGFKINIQSDNCRQ